jgi:GNAT superfamily N-acetyltransferase
VFKKKENTMQVRTMRPEDIDEVAAVESVAWGELAASPATIARRAAVFERGSIVVEDKGQIVGYAASQLTDHISTKSWDAQTDHGQIAGSHCPEGQVAYGVSMSALPGVVGKGVAFHVINAYADMYLGGGCSVMCVGSRVPGFAKTRAHSPDLSLTQYVRRGEDGRYQDPELRLYAANGFDVLWELPDYFPDAKSAGHGAMMIRSRL